MAAEEVVANSNVQQHANDPFDLRHRYVLKQKEVFARALSEIKAGRKSRYLHLMTHASGIHLYQEFVYTHAVVLTKKSCHAATGCGMCYQRRPSLRVVRSVVAA